MNEKAPAEKSSIHAPLPPICFFVTCPCRRRARIQLLLHQLLPPLRTGRFSRQHHTQTEGVPQKKPHRGFRAKFHPLWSTDAINCSARSRFLHSQHGLDCFQGLSTCFPMMPACVCRDRPPRWRWFAKMWLDTRICDSFLWAARSLANWFSSPTLDTRHGPNTQDFCRPGRVPRITYLLDHSRRDGTILLLCAETLHSEQIALLPFLPFNNRLLWFRRTWLTNAAACQAWFENRLSHETYLFCACFFSSCFWGEEFEWVTINDKWTWPRS